MHIVDLIIIVAYLAAVIGAGFYFGRRQQTTTRYFLAGHEVPWWAISASIVATETSTVTFISVPGIAYAAGGDFRFLQIVLGYLVARVVISVLFMPAYFRRELVTVYELLHERFGGAVKGLAATLFVIMRTIADGVRLLLTAFVLAAVFRSLGLAEGTVTGSIILIGAVMIVFTLIGGIEAIVWVEVVQLLIYIAGAIAAAAVLGREIVGGVATAIDLGTAFDKFRVFDFTFDLTRTFTFWSGVIGGAFLTMSTHGTDQYMVQRYLCTDRPRKAAAALLLSGVIVLVQFIGFLFIGVLLFAFYRPDRLPGYGPAAAAAPFAAADQVFPDFITNHLPVGLSGLVVAAIFAAAMSSSLNSIAATVVADLYAPVAPGRPDRHYLNVSRVVTVLAGIAQIGVGVAMQQTARSALNTVLSVASLINGPILGVFLLGATRRGGRVAAFTGMSAGLAVVLYVAFATSVAWPWYTLIGSMTTVVVGRIVAQFENVRHSIVIALIAFALTMCASAPRQVRVEQLTLDEKIGQMFVAAGHGLFTNESGWRYRELSHHVRDNKVGGVIWFVSNVYETAFLTEQLQKEARIPLLVSADLEAGIGMRFLDATFWPSAMAVGATGDPKWAEEVGRISAREARALGVNHILAPVADVNVNADNPVINTRSYGEDPQQVARFVAAFIRGVQEEGVLATAKHFPGHGDTHVDSHRALPVLDVDRQRLEQVELVPFRAAIEAGVGSVMIGHLSVPALDPAAAPVRALAESDRENPYGTALSELPQAGTVPATLSSKVIQDLLRKELGFKGLVVSDAFDMGALVAHYGVGEAAVRGIEAGEDQILKTPNLDLAVQAVKDAVRSGRIPETRIDQSVRRILAAKARVSAAVGSPAEIFRIVDASAHRQIADEIARRALTLLREQPGVLPVAIEARVVVVTISDIADPAHMLTTFNREVGRRLSQRPRTFFLDARATPEEVQTVAEAARNADLVLLALAIRARSGAGQIALPDAARPLLLQLSQDVEVVGLSFGSPYILRELPWLRTYLCAYGIQPVMQAAAAQALFGEINTSGKLPVTIPGLHARGEGIQPKIQNPKSKIE